MKTRAGLLSMVRGRRGLLLLGVVGIVGLVGVIVIGVVVGAGVLRPSPRSTSEATSLPPASAPPRSSGDSSQGPIGASGQGSAASAATTTTRSDSGVAQSGGVAWLAATSLPLAGIYHWTWSDVPDPMFLGYVCGSGSFKQLGAVSVAGRSALEGVAASSSYYNEFTAQEQVYTFAGSQAAAEAFASIAAGAHRCAPTSSGATSPGVHETAGSAQCAAFALYPAPVTASGFGGAVREVHEYLAVHTNVIAVLDVVTATSTGTPSQLYLGDVRDQSVLDALTASLFGPTG